MLRPRHRYAVDSARSCFLEVSPAQWDDWRWQTRNCVRDLTTLEKIFRLSDDERRGVELTRKSFRLSIPPYYAALADPDDPSCPIRMQAIPRTAETAVSEHSMADPLGEERHNPAPGIVHRYPDRALLLVNNVCTVYCRFCTRKRLTALENDAITPPQLQQSLDYIRRTPQIRDVLISGGDPLVMSDAKLDTLLAELREIPHVEIIRIGTRMPVVTPQRITQALCEVLKSHHPLWLVTHFNHPKELTPEALRACKRMADAGVPVNNQSVLLRGVNSSARVIKDLCHRLVRARVRPYYLHQSDLAEGLEHLRTPIAKGIEIIEKLQSWTSGYAVPKLVIDAPGGGGKVPLSPNYILSSTKAQTLLRTYDGQQIAYPEPKETDCTVPYEDKWFSTHPPTAALDAKPPGPHRVASRVTGDRRQETGDRNSATTTPNP